MLKIGINENVLFLGTEKDDKGAYNLKFNETLPGEKKDLFDLIQSNEVVDNDQVSSFKVFSPNILDFDKVTKRTAAAIGEDLNNVKNLLVHIIQGYLTQKDIKFNPFEGMAVENKADFEAKMTNEDAVKKVYENLFIQFSAMWAAVPEADKGKRFKLLLVRRSKDSPYYDLRKKYLSEQPIWEPQEVTPSKLAFSSYEKSNNLHLPMEAKPSKGNADPVTDTTPVSENVLNSILGTR